MTWATIDRQLTAMEARIRAELVPPVRLSAAQMAGRLGITLDPWQLRVLETPWREALLNCGRQTGKSTVSALLGIQETLYAPRGKVVVVSPSERQSGLLFQTALEMYRALGDGDSGVVESDIENRLSLELRNGNKFYALPGKQKTIRGFSGISLLIIDEASQVDDELYNAIRPMRAVSGGRLLAPSTPFGKRGWWWNAFENGGPHWYRETIPSALCPRIDPAFLAREQADLPAMTYAAEYECQFTDTVDQYYPSDLVDAAFSTSVRPLEL